MITILPTDRMFKDSPDAGDPLCICSRCLLPIGEADLPIRAFAESGRGEYRYHVKCQGGVTCADL